MRNYIDRIFSESSKVPKKRKRIQANAYYENKKEEKAPFKAPKWTVRGYQGTLKKLIEDACKERYSEDNDTETRPSNTHSSVDEN